MKCTRIVFVRNSNYSTRMFDVNNIRFQHRPVSLVVDCIRISFEICYHIHVVAMFIDASISLRFFPCCSFHIQYLHRCNRIVSVASLWDSFRANIENINTQDTSFSLRGVVLRCSLLFSVFAYLSSPRQATQWHFNYALFSLSIAEYKY